MVFLFLDLFSFVSVLLEHKLVFLGQDPTTIVATAIPILITLVYCLAGFGGSIIIITLMCFISFVTLCLLLEHVFKVGYNLSWGFVEDAVSCLAALKASGTCGVVTEGASLAEVVPALGHDRA